MKYYIITETEGLPPAPDFTSRLIARWPGSTVEQISNPERSYDLEFQVPMAHSHVEGLLDRTGSSSLNGEVKVTSPMTATDILQAFYASGG